MLSLLRWNNFVYTAVAVESVVSETRELVYLLQYNLTPPD